MEQCNDSTLKFGATTDVDGGRRKSFPDDTFTDVGGYEEGDAWAETIAFL